MKLQNQIVMAPEGTPEGGGGVGSDAFFREEEGMGEVMESQEGTTEGSAEATATAEVGVEGSEGDSAGARQQAVAQLSEEQLKRLIQAASSKEPAGEAGESKPMSAEEYEKLFNVVKVGEQEVEALLDPDSTPAQKAEALQGLLHATARMATTISAYQMALLRDQLEKNLQPAVQFAQAQAEQKLAEEFLSTYPDMKGYEPLLLLIRDKLVKEGAKFDSKEEAFKAVYARAQEVMKRLPNSPGTSGAAPKGGTSKPKMSVVSGGGGVGKSGGPKLTPAEQLARELFDD